MYRFNSWVNQRNSTTMNQLQIRSNTNQLQQKRIESEPTVEWAVAGESETGREPETDGRLGCGRRQAETGTKWVVGGDGRRPTWKLELSKPPSKSNYRRVEGRARD